MIDCNLSKERLAFKSRGGGSALTCAKSLLVATALIIVPASSVFSADLSLKDDNIALDRPERPKWNKWVWDNSTLEFHGYNRTTVGASVGADGDTQAKFRAPGAGAAYRLGNEPDFNLELALGYKYFLDGNPELGAAKNSRYIGLNFRVDEYKAVDNFDNIRLCLKWEARSDDGDCSRDLAELYLSLGNFIGDGTEIWVGRRWGERLDVHMNDYFYNKPGQQSYLGGGVTGIRVSSGVTLDLQGYYYKDSADLNGGLASDSEAHTLEARLKGIPTVENGALTIIAQYANRDAVDLAGGVRINDADGFAIGATHTLSNVYGGRWNLFGFYREGAGLQDGSINRAADLEDHSSFEVGSDLYVEPGGDWAFQWATIYKVTDNASGGETNWFSTGIRPIYYINDRVNIAFETGVDFVDNSGGANNNASGALWKNTIALQLTTGRGYFNRPVVRVFGTYAAWDDDLKGQVGDAPGRDKGFLDDTDGFTFGVQFESWW